MSFSPSPRCQVPISLLEEAGLIGILSDSPRFPSGKASPLAPDTPPLENIEYALGTFYKPSQEELPLFLDLRIMNALFPFFSFLRRGILIFPGRNGYYLFPPNFFVVIFFLGGFSFFFFGGLR